MARSRCAAGPAAPPAGGALDIFAVIPAHRPPRPLESMSGYLTALGEDNQIRSLCTLISILFPHTSGVIAAMADVRVQAATLAATTAQAPADLVALTLTGLAQRFGCSTHPCRLSNFLAGALARHLRYCPCCLAQDGVRRLLWRFVWIEGCATHHCALVERCPHCN
jgi:ferredoxin-thioredoxin reductase catalytic subunit